MHPSVSLNLLCFADSRLGQDLEFCLDAGFARIGVPLARIELEGVDESIKTLTRSGLIVATIGVSRLFTLCDPARWPAETEALIRTLDIAAALGAETVYGPVGPAGSLDWDEAAAALTEAAKEVAAHSRQVRVPLILEQTNPLYADLDFVHSFQDATDLAEMTGLGLCLDLFPTWQERGLLDTARRALPSLHLVQVGDFVYGSRRIPDRAVPGDGVIPLQRIIGRLLDLGYQGAIDLELIGPRILEEGVRAAALRSGRYITQLLESLAD